MNTARVVVVSAAVLLLAACASTPKADLAAQTKIQGFDDGYDREYMNEVERRSARLGVMIRWINPPKAPKPRTDG